MFFTEHPRLNSILAISNTRFGGCSVLCYNVFDTLLKRDSAPVETGAFAWYNKEYKGGMYLRNPFSPKVRQLFFEVRYSCFLCGGNESCELHHIKGRESNSAFNGSVLCKECHAAVLHTDEEHAELLQKTAGWLTHLIAKSEYTITAKDAEFIFENKDLYGENIPALPRSSE